MEPSCAVIADIVGSRRLEDRAGAQAVVLDTLARAAEGIDLLRPPWATVGDEFQALAACLDDALTLTLRTQLLLPEGVGLRHGLGLGEATTLASPTAAASPGQEEGPAIQDGSSWWSAREALDLLGTPAARQRDARTLLRVAQDPPQSAYLEPTVNAMLALRDHVVGRMKARERRLAAGLALGRSQTEMAHAEGIGQSAVSQSLHRSGAIMLLRPLTFPERIRS